ncbi:Scr1 family TA system antitoxin-like transcriptional regulator, partial [Actinoalloteichus caeruleus]
MDSEQWSRHGAHQAGNLPLNRRISAGKGDVAYRASRHARLVLVERVGSAAVVSSDRARGTTACGAYSLRDQVALPELAPGERGTGCGLRVRAGHRTAGTTPLALTRSGPKAGSGDGERPAGRGGRPGGHLGVVAGRRLSHLPGLLQTRGYAEAVMRATLTPPSQAESWVQIRLARQRVLETARCTFVLDESVLARPAGPAIMAEQLTHIAEVAEAGRAAVHVLPY